MLTSVCNYSQVRREIQSETLTSVCFGVIKEVSREVSRFINTYDVTIDVCLSSISAESQFLSKLVNLDLTPMQLSLSFESCFKYLLIDFKAKL